MLKSLTMFQMLRQLSIGYQQKYDYTGGNPEQK
jgi:hypothetical protein